MLSYRAIAANLDGLAEVWRWTARDVLVHALPLFHVHGLVLGTLGPVRVGSPLVHVGKFSPEGIAAALADGGTMLFGVPTMYHRLAKAAEAESARLRVCIRREGVGGRAAARIGIGAARGAGSRHHPAADRQVSDRTLRTDRDVDRLRDATRGVRVSGESRCRAAGAGRRRAAGG